MPHPQGYLLRAVRNMPAKARSGLYAGKQVGVVNRVSSEYEVRSKKYVKPNVHKVRLYSQALGQMVHLPVTAYALRRIDAAGGLDRYLLKMPDSLLHSDVGSDLKFRLSLIYRNKLQQQRQQQKQDAARLEAGGTVLPAGGSSLASSSSSSGGGGGSSSSSSGHGHSGSHEGSSSSSVGSSTSHHGRAD